ncbi:DNA polymerase X family [Desulfocucumis palustris]|uniref:DNA-directed DNA polymerase n=2 Tax=Desulfocucumis palustris TaxID=1898651 RepID=A0A2L2X956_9FIRM|nr:DNA polymerase X family [Desulfocucumis palustris]
MFEVFILHNMEIAWSFYELADLLEFKGDDFFKLRAYRNAAKTIAGLPEPVERLYREKKLAKVPGIGKNILAKIGELVATGKMEKLERLRREIPGGVLEIMALPGVGAKRASIFYQQLGAASLDQLLQAAREHRIRALAGMGAKTELEIVRNIDILRNRAGSFLLGLARQLADELTGFIKMLPEALKVEVAGSVRRWRETVGDLDILVASREPEQVLDAVALYPRTREILERKRNIIKVATWWGIPVEVAVVSPEQFWFALLWNTGSKKHLEQLINLSLSKGFKLEPGGLSGNGHQALIPHSEGDIYSRLGLQYIPPELREGRGEVEQADAHALPELLENGDIKGDLHLHSNWSDGGNSIGEIAARAREKGYSYIAVTDHSQSLKIARGLTPERLEEQYALIDGLNGEYTDFTVLKGIEVDILAGGGLDLPDQVLETADVVVASVHSGFRQDPETITSRILQAVESEHVDIIGHLTGRMLGQREGYAVDVERVLEAAARHGKIMEINSSPDRLDLNDENVRLAREYGVKIAINTDAHDLKRLDEMEYGVATARRGGLESRDVVNTLELPELLKILRR